MVNDDRASPNGTSQYAMAEQPAQCHSSLCTIPRCARCGLGIRRENQSILTGIDSDALGAGDVAVELSALEFSSACATEATITARGGAANGLSHCDISAFVTLLVRE